MKINFPYSFFLNMAIGLHLFRAVQGAETVLNLTSYNPEYLHEKQTIAHLGDHVEDARNLGEVNKLLSLKEEFEALPYPETTWKVLSEELTVNRQDSYRWPWQNYKEHVGAELFFTRGRESFALGRAAALTLSALYGDPISLHYLGGSYYTLYSPFIKDEFGADGQRRKEIGKQIRRKVLSMLELIPKGENPRSRYAEYWRVFISNHYFIPLPGQQDYVSFKEYVATFDRIGPHVPRAYFQLSRRFYISHNFDQALFYIKKCFDPMGSEAYGRAADMLIHLKKFYDPTIDQQEIDTYINRAGAFGLYLKASLALDEKRYEEAIRLYEEAGQQGYAEAYTHLAYLIMDHRPPYHGEEHIRAREYKFKADVFTDASASYTSVSPLHCPKRDLTYCLHMIELKDIRGYYGLLRCFKYPSYHKHQIQLVEHFLGRKPIHMSEDTTRVREIIEEMQAPLKHQWELTYGLIESALSLFGINM